MKNKEREKEVINQVREGLDREAENLDPATASRLRRMRYSALEQIDSAGIKLRRPLRIPAAVIATVAILAVLTTTVFRTPTILPDHNALADLEILASDEQLNLFEELDFYSWLAETEDHAG